ncbi:MAG: hypothetical protein WKF84_06175 [Pyrinomonadaceae bacterium]
MESISEIAGEALLMNGERAKAYRALRPVFCTGCTNVINIGDLFTRAELRRIQLLPRCIECAPFEVKAEEEGREQALIRNLLSPLSTGNEISLAENERAKEEVQKRIGPALKRVRRRV